MGQLFTIDAATRGVITQALDDIILEFGRDCLVVYPPRWVACANCHNDPVGRKGSNRWRHGGPMPFAAGTVCPMCRGQGGHHAEEHSESVRLKVEWEPRRFWKPFPQVEVRAPRSFCQTKFFSWDCHRLTQADHLVLDVPLVPVVRAKFRMVGAPVSPGNIIQDRYMVADWESVG